MSNSKIEVTNVEINKIKSADYNPRTWDKIQEESLTESIERFGMIDPLICNGAENRKNVCIGGHFRLNIAKKLGYKTVPVVYVNIPELEKEKELNLRLNKNTGSFDLKLLAEFDKTFLDMVGFSSEEIDDIFQVDPAPEQFDLKKELDKMDIKKVKVKKGDVYEIDGSYLMCGDSTIESDMLKLMAGAKADMVMTDPPYLLDYLKGKSKQKDGVTVGFGAKKNRRYLETESLPDNFTDFWNVQRSGHFLVEVSGLHINLTGVVIGHQKLLEI